MGLLIAVCAASAVVAEAWRTDRTTTVWRSGGVDESWRLTWRDDSVCPAVIGVYECRWFARRYLCVTSTIIRIDEGRRLTRRKDGVAVALSQGGRCAHEDSETNSEQP